MTLPCVDKSKHSGARHERHAPADNRRPPSLVGFIGLPLPLAYGARRKRFFGDPTPIQKNYLPQDLRQDARGFDIVNSVHIQVGVAEGDEVAETQWLQSCADRDGLPSAIVAFCDLTQDNRDAILDAHQQNANLRGIRQIVSRSAEEDAKTGTAALLKALRLPMA